MLEMVQSQLLRKRPVVEVSHLYSLSIPWALSVEVVPVPALVFHLAAKKMLSWEVPVHS